MSITDSTALKDAMRCVPGTPGARVSRSDFQILREESKIESKIQNQKRMSVESAAMERLMKRMYSGLEEEREKTKEKMENVKRKTIMKQETGETSQGGSGQATV